MPGLHLTADLYRCRCEAAWLTEADQLGPWCVQTLQAVGLHPAQQLFHHLPERAGVAGAVLLGDAHLCVHTWAGERTAMLDVYVGQAGDGAGKARALMAALVNRFQPEWTEQRSLDRGDGE